MSATTPNDPLNAADKIAAEAVPVNFVEKATVADGAGCHSGKDMMREAAAAAGKSETLEQYAKDYPDGDRTINLRAWVPPSVLYASVCA